MQAIVFGSLNMDLVVRTQNLPVPGETLIGSSFETIPGGKGANQAVAIARLGLATELVGRVGNDEFGHQLLAELKENGVGCDRVWLDSSTRSGVAMIVVDAKGENQIIVVPGSNGQLDRSDLDRLQEILPQANVLLLQLEIPLESVVEAAQLAKQMGVSVILDPAPARSDLPDSLYAALDFITPNQVEAESLVGFEVHDRATAHRAAQVLRDRGVGTVIIKLGADGAFCLSATEAMMIPAFSVQAIDTVAAGDAFNGGLAAALAIGLSLKQSLIQASAVAALSVTKAGAQPSLPDRAELDAFLQANSDVVKKIQSNLEHGEF
jgi:ribokinase